MPSKSNYKRVTFSFWVSVYNLQVIISNFSAQRCSNSYKVSK